MHLCPSSVTILLASLVSGSLIKVGSEMVFPLDAVPQVEPQVFILCQSLRLGPTWIYHMNFYCACSFLMTQSSG